MQEGESIVMHEAAVTRLPEGAQVTVVEPSNPTALKEELESLTRGMYQIAFQQNRVVPSDSRAVEGSDTLREGKAEFLASLRAAGKDIESVINEALYHFAAYAGKSDFSGEIALNLDISDEDLEQQMLITRQHWDEIAKYPTWRKEINKKIAQGQNLENTGDVINEIETKQPEVEQQQQRVLDRRALFQQAAGINAGQA
jgi:uncharacterized protein (DUF2249 family)